MHAFIILFYLVKINIIFIFVNKIFPLEFFLFRMFLYEFKNNLSNVRII